MAVRAIVIHPDPVLRAPCAEVMRFDDALQSLANDMLETMYAAPGRGLAAPQVGESQRMFVMDVTWKEGAPAPQVFVNPVILAQSDNLEIREEGCLSIPDRIVSVERPASLRLRWQDVTGARREADFDGIAATCVQHEIDHLNGVLCIDPDRALP